MPLPIRTTLAALMMAPALVDGQTDDFNDGNDSGWTRQDSIGIILSSPFASYGFPDGGYRISAAESPAPSLIGPARAASFRQDHSYEGRIFLSVDIRITQPLIQQSAGFLAFVQPNPQPGAVSGYSLSYQPLTGDIVLNRIVNELPIRLAYAGLDALAAPTVRLILIAEDGVLTGALYNAGNLLNPIARLTAADGTFTTGTAGLFAFSDTDDATGPVDVIFDNYRANALTLPELTLGRQGESGFRLSWPDWAVHFAPSTSTLLGPAPWEPVPMEELQSSGGFLFHTGDLASGPRRFFRLERRPY